MGVRTDNQWQAETEESASAGFPHGRRLRVARVAWLTVAFLAIGLSIAGQSALYDRFRALEMYEADRRDLVRANLADIGLPVEYFAGYILSLGIILALVCFAVAALIFYRRSDQPMALFVATLLVLLGATFSGAIGAAGERNALLAWLSSVLTSLSVVTVFLVFFLFPNGHFAPRWTRWVSAIAILAFVPTSFLPGSSLNPEEWPDAVYGLFFAAMIITGIVAQVYRYRRISDYWQRQQTRWVAWGFALALGGYVIIGLLPAVWPSLEPGTPAQLIALAATIGFMLLIPLSFGVAILRYHLWDIDIVINKTLVYSVLTGVLLAVYFGGVVLLQSLFRATTGQSSELAIIVSTLVVAWLFQPVRRRVQSVVDRRFYRRKYDAARAIAAFTSTARDEVDAGRLTAAVESLLAQTVQPMHISVLVRNVSVADQRFYPVEPHQLPGDSGADTLQA